MAQSVTNDALWEKLSEIEKQLKSSKQTDNTFDFSSVKEEIFDEIERQAAKLGTHYDLNFKANEDNWKVTNEDLKKIFNIVSRIRMQQKETAEQLQPKDKGQQRDEKYYFIFWIFKVRKSSLVIVVLALLVFILTLFSMKQQNDYSLLMSEYYRQSIVIRKMQTEVDSLSIAVQKSEPAKKRR